MANSADLIFEIGTEELPPKALKTLAEALKLEFLAGLGKAELAHGAVELFATPRRLALLIRECSLRQPDRQTERRGPTVQSAFDKNGSPSKAAEGFARSCGVNLSELMIVQTDKGGCIAFVLQERGKNASELLPGIAETALIRLPIPKRMRWGSSDIEFVRPVQWLLFLHGSEIVSCTLLGAIAGNITHGHRFHHPEPIVIQSPCDYARLLLQSGHVIPSFDSRKETIKKLVERSAETLGGFADLDEDLLDEVTALNEWPVPILGSFESRFLDVPNEALVLTMKQNQKYFPLFDGERKLMNHFITIANIDSPRPELIKEGNERVVRPRLTDAMFFWHQDGKSRLEDRLESLKHLVFQKHLGSMYDKSVRVSSLASFIAAHIDADPQLAGRAGLLSRCDLMTEMVYEFPEMQGIMGRYQAGRDGESHLLAHAMDEFYMPRFSGDQLPTSGIGIAISIADRVDTLIGIFGIGLKPSGDKDPFALRRAALGVLRIILEHKLDIDLLILLQQADAGFNAAFNSDGLISLVYDFMVERLRGIYLEKGFSPDLFESVSALRLSSPSDFDARLRAVASFQNLDEAGSLAAANKRIRNILRKAGISHSLSIDISLFQEPAESALYQQLASLKTLIAPLLMKREYESVLKELSALRSAIDLFFDKVMVMADQLDIRMNRLALLQDVSTQFLKVADISCLQAQN